MPGEREVEVRRIHENRHVGATRQGGRANTAGEPQDAGQVLHDLREPHHRQLLATGHALEPGLAEPLATDPEHPDRRLLETQGADQVRGVEVPAGLAGHQEDVHLRLLHAARTATPNAAPTASATASPTSALRGGVKY